MVGSRFVSAVRPHAVAQVLHAWPARGTGEFQLDVLRRHVLEQPAPLPEQHRNQMDVQLVQRTGASASRVVTAPCTSTSLSPAASFALCTASVTSLT